MGLHCHVTKSYKAVDTLAPPNQNPGYATGCGGGGGGGGVGGGGVGISVT